MVCVGLHAPMSVVSRSEPSFLYSFTCTRDYSHSLFTCGKPHHFIVVAPVPSILPLVPLFEPHVVANLRAAAVMCGARGRMTRARTLTLDICDG